MEKSKVTAALIVAALVVIGGALAYLSLSSTPAACRPLGGTGPLRSVASVRSFGAVSEYQLPTPARWANGVTVAPDGSVWFGEEAVPGLGHLYTNGTLVEYPWPHKPSTTCGYQVGIWGVALWHGMVWGTDYEGSSLVGLDPQTGATTVLNVSATAPFPYTLAVSPDGLLWFTSLSGSPVLGRVGQDLSVSVLGVELPKGDVPAQVQFVNSTYAYFVAINPAANTGGIFAFNPQDAGRTITPVQVGAGFDLLSPNSISASAGRVWVTQHYPASIASYDIAAGSWTLYPTSTENYTSTTLPYFIQAAGGKVWFNEHYGNKIAVMDVETGTMTEYSEANPPIGNATNIQNDLTIALANGGLWFTSDTGNYVGFIDGSYRPPFSIAVDGSNSAAIPAGGSASFNLSVTGDWSSALRVQVSDTEGITGVPKLISVVPTSGLIQPGARQQTLSVAVSADGQLKPGRYTVGVTVTDGLIYRTAFIFLTVT